MMKRMMALMTALLLVFGLTAHAEPTPEKVNRATEKASEMVKVSRKSYDATSDPALVIVTVEEQGEIIGLEDYAPSDLFGPENAGMASPEGLAAAASSDASLTHTEYFGYEEEDADDVSFTVKKHTGYYAQVYRVEDMLWADAEPGYEYEWVHVQDVYHENGDEVIDIDMTKGFYEIEAEDPTLRYAVVYKPLNELVVIVDIEDGTGDIKTDELTPDGCLSNPTEGPIRATLNGTGEAFIGKTYTGYLQQNTTLEIPVKEVPGYYAEVYQSNDKSPDNTTEMYRWRYRATLYFEDGFRDDAFRELFYNDVTYLIIYKPKTYWVGFATLDENGQPSATDETLNAHPNGSVTLPTGPASYQYDADDPLSLILSLDEHYQVEAWHAYFYTYIPDSETSTRELKEITDVSMLTDTEGSIVIDGSVESVDGDLQHMAKRDAYDYLDRPFMIYAELKSTTVPPTEPTEPPTTEPPTTEPQTTEKKTTNSRTGTTTTAPMTTTTEPPTTTVETITVTETTVPQAVTLQEIIAQEIPQTGGLPMAGYSLGGSVLLGLGLLLKRKK